MSSNEDLVSSGLTTVKEASGFLNLSRGMIYKLMETGQLRYVRIGRTRRIPKLALVNLAKDSLIGGYKLL
jgi:excisionase family DNA binding protein